MYVKKYFVGAQIVNFLGAPQIFNGLLRIVSTFCTDIWGGIACDRIVIIQHVLVDVQLDRRKDDGELEENVWLQCKTDAVY